jgi:uncharacterized protein (DUF2342 family)
MTDDGAVSLVPRNVEEFSDGLEIPSDEVTQFLAVREVAHARLYSGAPWLRSHVLGIVHAYAREIRIDTEAMERAFREIDPSDPEHAPRGHGIGRVRARRDRHPAPRPREARDDPRGHRGLGGGGLHPGGAGSAGPRARAHGADAAPARGRWAGEDTFKSLVGLELRPRRLRDAAQLWATLTATAGIEERDAVWAHPDLMPSAAELDDPKDFAASRAQGSQDFDDALAALLDGEQSPDA